MNTDPAPGGLAGALRGACSRAALPILGLAACGLTTALVLAPGKVLKADGGSPLDSDGDGLKDALESPLQTSAFSLDTDGDGFLDAEEVARNSSPFRAEDTPLPSTLDVGMAAYGGGGSTHVVVAAYITDRNLSNKVFGLGVLVGKTLHEIPSSVLLEHATMEFGPASNPDHLVLLFDLAVNPAQIHAAGSLVIYTTLGVLGDPHVNAAATLHLTSVEGVVTWARPDRGFLPRLGPGGVGGPSPDAGTVYLPIPASGGGGLPQEWIPDEICYQVTRIVGFLDGVLVHEVISAECVPGWDSYCKPDCAASVGTTFMTLDPGSLLGG